MVTALVLSGLVWATRSAVQLERLEAEGVARREYENKLFLVTAHVDSFIDSVLAKERERDIEHYKAYYYPSSRMINVHSRLEFSGDVVQESPLVKLELPEWMLLHFQVAYPQKWGSPQLSEDGEWAMTADAIPESERARRATAANWMASLRERFDERSLLSLLERGDASTEEPNPGARSEVAADRSAAEFARRGRRLVMQMSTSEGEQCTPLPTMMRNLQADDREDVEASGTQECVEVRRTPMRPVWLRLTTEGQPQLALLRSISVRDYDHCAIQGVLIDWPRFRAMLDRELDSLFPGAMIEPIFGEESHDSRDLNRLRSIPARVAFPPPPAIAFSLSDGLRNGLIVAWSVTALALIAIAYGAMKYVSILERRMQFAAAVTHELRTPLTSFQLYSDLLADPAASEASRSGYVETLQRESRRLGRLVENVLLYSRLGDARPILHPRPVSPGAVLDAVSGQTGETCRAAGKELIVENACADGTTLTTDGEFVQQILSNLVENACKYSQQAEDHRIFLTAQANGACVKFAVEDAGPGVDPSERRAVFRPFRRGNPARDGSTGGVGLGLALSRHWAECLGGQLALTRGERNGGRLSRFVLRLPRSNGG